MNRMICWLTLDDSVIQNQLLNACQFNTPHWQPDHYDEYYSNKLAMSATQRFITSQCAEGLMPYQHTHSGCVINADVYLTNRESLCEKLNCAEQTSDAVLILQAYLKWGEQCTTYLAGQFCFILWDPRHQHLFVAVDQFAQCPLFYTYQPESFFLVANECSPFHALCPQLNINLRRLQEFAQDKHSTTATAYKEIHKIPAGHQLIITTKKLKQARYWNWKEHKQKLPYKTREQYYTALQYHFERAVQACLRSIGPLTTQLSGGLDSSAVTAQAALLLGANNQSLFAFTSIPNELSGESYRKGWYYHELDIIEDLLAQYTNIQHVTYKATPSTDIFEKLKHLQSCLDQPLRNINNFDWTLGCYEQVLKQDGRLLLIGTAGNGTISWSGSSRLETAKSFCAYLKAKILRRRNYWVKNLHQTMLSGKLSEPLRASVYPLQLWYGVRRMDPTQELNLTIFCYNTPQWVYRKNKHPLQQRLLTREGLDNILPKSITRNPYRGEQGADWYLHYNMFCEKWRQQLSNLTPNIQNILWQCYNQKKIMELFTLYPFLQHPPDRKITNALCFELLRCISLNLYLSIHCNLRHTAT